jgi:hypothetical protein
MVKLNIGTGSHGAFSLPLDAVTSTFAILAKKGSGKSYTASVIAEEFLKADQQIIVLDPTGAWSGLQSSADGKHEGFPVVVFGGDRGNVTLEEGAGEIIATAIVEKKFSAVLDLSLFRKAQSHRFVTVFIETLYRLNREPVHVFIDEADDLCPQKPYGNEAQTVGAIEDLVKRGRRKGIGCTLITQRPADIAKNVLTQADTLIAMRINHKLDLNPIETWIRVHADEKQATAMMESLPSLQTGTAWIWTPERDIFDRVKIRQRETFDSGATPKPGEKARTPQKLAAIDIKRLGEAIAETVENAKANDPRALKAEIAKLKRDLAEPKKQPTGSIDTVATERLIAKAVAERDRFWKVAIYERDKLLKFAKLGVESLQHHLANLPISDPPVNAMPSKIVAPASNPTATHYTSARVIPTEESKTITGSLRKIMVVVEQAGGSLPRETAAARAGLSGTSGSFSTWLSTARANGWLETQDGSLTVTEKGRVDLGSYDPLPTGEVLHRYWIDKVGGTPGRILSLLIDNYPNELSRETIGQHCEVSHTSGSFSTWLSTLRRMRLIEGSRDLKASATLFE